MSSTISQYKSGIGQQYYVGDLVINQNKLYRFGSTAKKFVAGTSYNQRELVKITIPSGGGFKITDNGGSTPVDSDKEVVIEVTGLTGSLSRDATALLRNPPPANVQAVFRLVRDGSNSAGVFDPRYWGEVGSFAAQDASTLQNYATNAIIRNATGNNLLILNPEHFSSTIFLRLKEKIDAITNTEVKLRLNSFLEFQKNGLVDRNTNTKKRQRVTPTAPFPIPGILDIPIGKTRVFKYGIYDPKDKKNTLSYTFKGIIIRQNSNNPNEYLIDASTILLKTKEGKWIDKYMGSDSSMEALVNDANEFFQHKNFWKKAPRDVNGIINLIIQKQNFEKWTPSQLHYLRPYFKFIDLISSTEDLNLNMARDRKYLDGVLVELQRLFERPTLNYAGQPERDIELRYSDVHSPYNVNMEDMFLHGERKLVVSFQAIEDFTYEIELKPNGLNPVYRTVKGGIHGKAQLVEHIADAAITYYDVKVRAASGSTHTNNLSRPHIALAPSVPPWDEIEKNRHTLTPLTQAQVDKLRNKFVMSLYDVDKLRIEIEGKFKTLWDYLASDPVIFNPFPNNVQRYKWDDVLDVPSNWNQLTKKAKIHVIVYNAYEDVRNKNGSLQNDILDAMGDSRLRQYINMNAESLNLKENQHFDVFTTKFASSGLTYQGTYDATKSYSLNDAVNNGGDYYKVVRRNGVLGWEKIYQPLSLTEKVGQTYPINYVNQNKRQNYSGTLNTLLSGEKSRSIFQKMDATFMLSLDFRKKVDDYVAFYDTLNTALNTTRDFKNICKNKMFQSLPSVQLDLEDENKECARLRKISLCLKKSTEAGYPVVMRHATNAFDSAYSDTRSHMRSRRWTQGVLWERTDKEPGTLIIPGTQRMGRLLDTTKRRDGVNYMNNDSVMQDLLGTGPLYDIPGSTGMNGPALVKVRESTGASGASKKGMLQHPLYPSRTKARAQILIDQNRTPPAPPYRENSIAMSDPLVTDRAAYSADVNSVIDIEL